MFSCLIVRYICSVLHEKAVLSKFFSLADYRLFLTDKIKFRRIKVVLRGIRLVVLMSPWPYYLLFCTGLEGMRTGGTYKTQVPKFVA